MIYVYAGNQILQTCGSKFGGKAPSASSIASMPSIHVSDLTSGERVLPSTACEKGQKKEIVCGVHTIGRC